MVIHFSNYNGGYIVFSLAKDDLALQHLLELGCNVLYICHSNVVLYPFQITFSISLEEKTKIIEKCNDYDIFELNENGCAVRCYDSSSIDNAITISNKCNSNCLMCPTAERIRRDYDSNSDFPEIIRHIPKDAIHITITGGEPFIKKKKIFEVLECLKANLPNTEFLLLTNGRAFCSAEYTLMLENSLPNNTTIAIPIHGYNQETHDYITQAEGSFRQTCLGLRRLRSIQAKIEIRIVVSKLNCDYIFQIAKLIANSFPYIYCVKIIAMEMTGNAAKNRSSVWIDYPNAFQKSKNAIDFLIHSGINVGLYNFPLCSVEERYWYICEKSISENKIRFAAECGDCKIRDACGGIFAGTIRLAKERIRPL